MTGRRGHLRLAIAASLVVAQACAGDGPRRADDCVPSRELLPRPGRYQLELAGDERLVTEWRRGEAGAVCWGDWGCLVATPGGVGNTYGALLLPARPCVRLLRLPERSLEPAHVTLYKADLQVCAYRMQVHRTYRYGYDLCTRTR